MSHSAIMEEVWKLFRENALQQKETDRLLQEMVREANERSARLDHELRERAAEWERLAVERERQERERAAERERQERERAAEREQQERERAAERERLAAEWERQERERAAERERQEQERVAERERQEQERVAEQERAAERERQEQERTAERERQEQERAAERERQERERVAERERQEQERAARVEALRVEMARTHEETERAVKEVTRQVGALTGKWGQFVENLVAPACEWLFAERGIPVHVVAQRVKARLDGGRNMEVDILVINTTAAVLVEVKSTLTVEAVKEHLQRLEEFKLFFPAYRDKQVLGAVAGIVSEEGAEGFARNQGLFVITQSGDTVQLANPPDFVPRAW